MIKMSALIAIFCCCAVEASPPQNADPVKLDEDSKNWYLNNGLVKLTIHKELAKLTHLALVNGPELLTEGGYYDTNASPGGLGRSEYLRFGHHEPVIAEVAVETEDIVDLVLTTDVENITSASHPLRCEFHYVLRRGDPGFYVYWLRWHKQDMPTCALGQTRHVMRCSREIFNRWQITDDRCGEFPTPAERKAAKVAYDATIQLEDGRYMTKYSNAVATAGHHLSGLYSDTHKIGLWQINPSSEYINGGPTKQNLTIHEEDPILLHMVQSGHYGGGRADIEGDWAKLYGPIFYYVNSDGSAKELWQDAKQRVEIEQASWPYQWVMPKSVKDAYPLVRGTVKGQVKRSDNESTAGAMAILAAPDTEWQFQGLGYIFWDHVNADGTFEISNVLAGNYTLYIFQPGVFGEARQDNIVVDAGKITQVNTVTLTPKTGGKLIWQIGVPDRSAAEYHHGDNFRHVYLHKRYPEEFPNDVRFAIGESIAKRDWNYYQPGERTWQVIFQMQKPPNKQVLLTIAVADSGYSPPATIIANVNGKDPNTIKLDGGANGLWRLGIYGVYQVRTLAIPAQYFKAGENVLSLRLPHGRAWVMYDFLRLEDIEP